MEDCLMVADLIAEVESFGASVFIEDGRPKLRNAKKVPETLLARLTAHRDSVITYLSSVPTESLSVPVVAPQTPSTISGDEVLADAALLLHIIVNAARNGLAIEEPQVGPLHVDQALAVIREGRNVLPRLQALGRDVLMAALVLEYNRRVEQLRELRERTEIDPFCLEAALVISAIHPKRESGAWYAGLLAGVSIEEGAA
jgi:hypothetical protein